jgi:hypothetical protein
MSGDDITIRKMKSAGGGYDGEKGDDARRKAGRELA